MNIASVALVRDAEQRVIASGIDGYRLMRRAGIAAARMIEELFPRRKRTVIICGGGNNGGDALVAAAHLEGDVIVYSTSCADDFRNESACAIRDLPENIPFIVFEEFPDGVFQSGDNIIRNFGERTDPGILYCIFYRVFFNQICHKSEPFEDKVVDCPFFMEFGESSLCIISIREISRLQASLRK